MVQGQQMRVLRLSFRPKGCHHAHLPPLFLDMYLSKLSCRSYGSSCSSSPLSWIPFSSCASFHPPRRNLIQNLMSPRKSPRMIPQSLNRRNLNLTKIRFSFSFFAGPSCLNLRSAPCQSLILVRWSYLFHFPHLFSWWRLSFAYVEAKVNGPIQGYKWLSRANAYDWIKEN